MSIEVDKILTSLCRTAGTTLTLSHPSPLWSETGTSPSPRCPPAPCGRRPSSSQVSHACRADKCCVRQRQKLCRPVFFSGGSATSSPAMLGFRRHSSNYQRAQSSMQLDAFYEDNSLHKRQHTGLHACFAALFRNPGRSLRFLTSVLLPLDFRVREETSLLHWNVLVTVRRGSEEVPGETFLSATFTDVMPHVPLSILTKK